MTPKLTLDRLVSAAIALVDEDGAEALSMRTLAKRVDRQASSLYNHVGGRAELIEAMRARIVDRIDVGAFARDTWDVAITLWARSYLAAFAEHPHLIRLLATTPIRDGSTLAMYDVVVGALARGGWGAGESVALMRAVEAFVLGSALDIVAPGNMLDPAAVPPEHVALSAALAPQELQGGQAQVAFDLGLTAIVAGFKDRASLKDGASGRG